MLNLNGMLTRVVANDTAAIAPHTVKSTPCWVGLNGGVNFVHKDIEDANTLVRANLRFARYVYN